MGPKVTEEPIFPILVVDNLSIFLKSNKIILPLLQSLSFTISKNERIGLIGHSGSGKSITMKAILDILPESLVISQNNPIRFQKNKNNYKQLK